MAKKPTESKTPIEELLDSVSLEPEDEEYIEEAYHQELRRLAVEEHVRRAQNRAYRDFERQKSGR